MTLMPPTRKRTRSCEEEEFLPLSKKINNLHINNWGGGGGGGVDSPQEQLIKWNPSTQQFLSVYSEDALNGSQGSTSRNSSPFKSVEENLQNCYNDTELSEHFKRVNSEYKSGNYSESEYVNGESSSGDCREDNNWTMVYNPDLSLQENPYYYESNKLLFDLYVERLQRNGY